MTILRAMVSYTSKGAAITLFPRKSRLLFNYFLALLIPYYILRPHDESSRLCIPTKRFSYHQPLLSFRPTILAVEKKSILQINN